MLQIHLFGALRVLMDGAPHTARTLPRTWPLLAYLLLHRQQQVKRQRLAFTFWPDEDEEMAKANLRRHLYDLRRALPPSPPDAPWLLIERDAVQWNLQAPFWLDVAEFERLAGDPTGLEVAAQIQTDDLLPEVYEDWVFFERERLCNLLFDCLERAIAQREAAQDYDRAIELAEQILRRDPLREETSRLLMALHFRNGSRQEALYEYRRLEQALRVELDVPPMPETTAVYAAIVRGDLPVPTTRPLRHEPPPPPSNLPAQTTSFVGRDEELAVLRDLLCGASAWATRGADEMVDRPAERRRLLTITGAGGSGKTRLSLELAASILREAPGCIPDGAWFVPFSLIGDAGLAAPAIGAALGVRESGRASLWSDIKRHLRDKRLLLLLDNFEHIMPAAGLVAELLTTAPGLSILVTSRAPLRLYGEQEYPLAPLAVQSDGRSAAMALFVDRARAANPAFALTPDNAGAVAEICARLDGLPLAIELAAARARLFAPAAMLGRLESGLPFLAAQTRERPARQTTLRAAIDWSYHLLSAAERRRFVQLGVFVGGFTAAEAAEMIGVADADEMLEELSALAAQSMLRISPASARGAEPRFWMMTLLREYARERLAAQGELEEMQRRHAAYFATLAQHGAEGLRGNDQLVWFRRLDAQQDNLRAALTWSCGRPAPDAHLGLALAAALRWFWNLNDQRSEGVAWLKRALAAAPEAENRPLAQACTALAMLLSVIGRIEDAVLLLQRSLDLLASETDGCERGEALLFLARAEFRQKRYDAAQQLSGQAADIFGRLGDRFGEALALRTTGDVLRLTGCYEDAERYYGQALAAARPLGAGWALGTTLNSLGELMRLIGRHERAAEIYAEEIGLWRAGGSRSELATALHNQGHAMLRLGQPERAQRCLREGLALHQTTDYRRGVCLCLAGLAGVAAQCGSAQRAAQLLAAVSVHLTPMGAHLMGPADQAEYDWHLQTVRAALESEAFNRAWETGRSLTFEQALDLGLA